MIQRIRQSLFFRRTALLAVLAVLLPVLVMLVHRPAYAASLRLHICSAAKTSGDHVPAGKTLASCPICQNIHHSGHGFVPPPAVKLTVPFAAGTLVHAPLDETRIIVTVRTASWPRAPPVFA